MDTAAFGAHSEDSELSREEQDVLKERRRLEKERIRRRVRRRFLWFRFKLVFLWMLSNIGLIAAVWYFQDVATTPFLVAILFCLVIMNGSRMIGSILYLTSNQSSSSVLVVILTAPFRLNTYLSLLKLPFSVVFSVLAALGALFSFVMDEDVASHILRQLAELDLSFNFVGTSRAKYSLKCADKSPESLEFDAQHTRKLRRYFLLPRLALPIVALLVIFVSSFMFVDAIAPDWGICDATMCISLPEVASYIVAPFLLLIIFNAGILVDFTLRKMSQRINHLS